MRVPPFDHAEALRMLEELKGVRVLDGARGRRPIDRGKLAELLVRLGRFAAMNRDLVEEIDINPLIATDTQGGDLCAVDGLFVLKPSSPTPGEGSHGS
jgi:hypothetical protein